MNQHKSLLTHVSEWWDTRRSFTHIEKSRSRWLPSPGNILFTLLIAGLLIITQRAWATNTQSINAPGPSATTINYQGRLADDAGNPQNGAFGMSFAIWDATSGGSIIWGPENHSAVPVTNGLFNVGLGSQTGGGIPTTVWNGDRYLEITVGGETLAPRELIRSVPIAGLALTVPDAAITSEKMAPSIISNFKNVEVPISDDGNPTEVLSLTVNFPTDATYLIFAQTNTINDFNNRVIVSLQDENGITIPGSLTHTPHTESGYQSSHSTSLTTIYNFSAGQHSIRLMAGAEGSPGSGAVRNAHIIAIPFNNN